MPKIKFNESSILDASFKIASSHGYQALTVRAVAKEVGCSTAPIYTAFKTHEQLVEATKNKAVEVLLTFFTNEYTPNRFLNIGVGILNFADQYPLLYQDLAMLSYSPAREDKIFKRFEALMIDDPLNQFVTKKELKAIMSKMWIFTQGMAFMVLTGSIKINTPMDFITMLDEVGDDVIASTLLRNGKLNAFMSMSDSERKLKTANAYEYEHKKHDWNLW